MIDLILLGILIAGIFIGLKRGFILQVFHLLGFIAAFLVAAIYYDDVASRMDLWIPYPELPEGATWAVFLDTLPLEAAFYNAIAFTALFFVTKIILQIIASMLDFVADLPFLSSVNGLLGAILGFVETYLLLFIILYIVALAPIEVIQGTLENSSIAAFIIENTPIVSNHVETLWFEHVATK